MKNKSNNRGNKNSSSDDYRQIYIPRDTGIVKIKRKWRDGKIEDEEIEMHPKPISKLVWFGVITGTLFMIGFIAILIFIPCPTDSQSNYFKSILAISIAAYSAAVMGSIKFFHAGFVFVGGFAVMALIFFWNPANISGKKCLINKHFKGIYYLDNKLTKDIQITFPILSRVFHTDTLGKVEFDYPEQTNIYPLKAICQYQNLVDTTILIAAEDGQDVFEIYLHSH